ncbi:MAG: amino acid decarboxylase [Vicinamibacteraceae bacterium]|nr:amino acid decarboxylase [Vicinamibacteraceae bacterium]
MPGDMPSNEFREAGYRLVDWIADYLAHSERYPVLARVGPGEVGARIPDAPPAGGVSFDQIMESFERDLVPGLTHWNHPSFFGYFSISASAPAVLAEFLSSALNQQAMLWRTSPAATELEERALGWLRQMMGLPECFEGVIYDTASMSTLHALAAAREAAVDGVRQEGLTRPGGRPLRVYCSEQAHSSVDKAVILLGLGHSALVKIPVDDAFRMRPDALSEAIDADRRAGFAPLAVVATVGTTSTTSVDPVPAIADICERESLWLHVDAAYGGAAAVLDDYRWVLEGAARADSLVMNPHKWLFIPFDLSAFYCRRMDVVRQAFSLVPEYLRTTEASPVRNLMDTGVQLGRRFRSLKLWMMLNYFGTEGVAVRIREHIRLAALFAGWVDAAPGFERLAPTPLSVVCFRAVPPSLAGDEEALERFNQALMDAVNDTGRLFISHTKLAGRFTLRLAIGNIHTMERHVRDAWDLIVSTAARLAD